MGWCRTFLDLRAPLTLKWLCVQFLCHVCFIQTVIFSRTPLLFARGLWWWFLCLLPQDSRSWRWGTNSRWCAWQCSPTTLKCSCVGVTAQRSRPGTPVPARSAASLLSSTVGLSLLDLDSNSICFLWNTFVMETIDEVYTFGTILSGTLGRLCQTLNLIFVPRSDFSLWLSVTESHLTALSRHANLQCGALHPFWHEFRLACSQLPSH